jgi:hypothetical protein
LTPLKKFTFDARQEAAAERGGNNSKSFHAFHLKGAEAKANI